MGLSLEVMVVRIDGVDYWQKRFDVGMLWMLLAVIVDVYGLTESVSSYFISVLTFDSYELTRSTRGEGSGGGVRSGGVDWRRGESGVKGMAGKPGTDTDSSCDEILKKYNNTLPLTECQLVKYLRKVSTVLFDMITEDSWEKYQEAAVNYANLKASIDDYYDENIAHIDKIDKLVEASMSSFDKSNTTITDLYKGADGRNFDVHKPFAFCEFGISELDEPREIIPKKKNVVVQDLMNSLSRRYERIRKIHRKLRIKSAGPDPAPEQASSKSSRKKRKHMELEPKIKIHGLECNRALPENVLFVNNMVIKEPEHKIFFTDEFDDQAF
nr:hypothetical protein [Tanacetum cinerariifolium]